MQSGLWLFHRVLIVTAVMCISQGWRSPMAMASAEKPLRGLADRVDLETHSVPSGSAFSIANGSLDLAQSHAEWGDEPEPWHGSTSLKMENSWDIAATKTEGAASEGSSASELFQPVLAPATLALIPFGDSARDSLTRTPALELRADTSLDESDAPSRDVLPPESETPTGELIVGDPELGVLLLRELPVRRFNILDPELGVLRLQEVPLPADESYPWLYWRTQAGFFWTDNVLSASEDPVSEGIYLLRTTLSAYPELNSRTSAVATLSGGITRYSDEFELDTQQFDVGLGIYHAVTPRAYIQGGWQHEQFFTRTDGDRFLSDHTLYFNLGRQDQLTSRLSLNTAYAFEYSLTDPNERSRVFNRAYAYLRYDVTPALNAGLFYQVEFTDFTRQDRNDYSHQIIGSLNYDISSISQLSIYGGSRLGGSSESFIDLDSTFLGVSLSINLPLF
ncbi:MAG: hypothetical protein WBA57_16440 [Elainellaceae cyanobacterium]